jgi:hypothetical protein
VKVSRRGDVRCAGAGRRQFVERPVGVVGEVAVGIDREQRARGQHDRGIDVAGIAVGGADDERVIGIAVRSRPVVGEHASAEHRALGGGDGVVLQHPGVVLRRDVDHLREARTRVEEVAYAAFPYPGDEVEVAVAVEVGEGGRAG